jgi:hypothetical protein
MADSQHIDALLHLGALGIAITAGYLGLDRVRTERDKLHDEIEEVRRSVKDIIGDLDMKVPNRAGLSKAKLKMMFNNYAAYVLCHVSDEQVSLGCGASLT